MKKLFSLFAAVLMAGSLMAEDATLIKFETVQPATEVAGSTYGSDGFTLVIPSESDKATVDANNCTFGVSDEDNIQFTHRLKTGGKSDKDGRIFTLNIPEEGPLAIYARPSSKDATDRSFLIANGADTIAYHICLDTDTVEGASSKIFLPVIVENVPAGSYKITYNNGINFYGFQLGYDEPADPIELEFTSFETDVNPSSVLITLNGPNVQLIYDAAYADKSIAGIHNDAKEENIVLTYDVEEYLDDYILEGTAEFTFVSVTQSIVYTYIVSFNLVGVSGNEYHAETQIQIVGGDFSNDIPSSWDGTVSLSKTEFRTLADLEGLTLTFNGATAVALAEYPEYILFQNEDGSEMYAIWSPNEAYGGTYIVDGNTIKLYNWSAQEALPAVDCSVYFEDYGTFSVDGEEDYFETVEASYIAPTPTTYTVTYTVTGLVEGAGSAEAGYYNESMTVSGNFEEGENTVPENVSAYVSTVVLEGYVVKVKVNGEAVTLTNGQWYSDGPITDDMTIEVVFRTTATAVENIEAVKATKVVKDGQVMIIRDSKTYNVMGMQL